MARNSLQSFTINPKKIFTPTVSNKIGATAIEAIRSRIRDARDISDSPAAPYSPNGPIYIPVVSGHKGRDKFRGRKGGVARQGDGYGLTRRFANKQNAHWQSDGYSRTGNSLRFENWQHYKQYLGHRGDRDLEVSGKLLGSIVITEADATHVSIGFVDARQEAIMRGNSARSEQWGLSPEDIKIIDMIVEDIIKQRIEDIFN